MAEIENLKIGSGGTIHIVGNEDIVAEAWAAGQSYVKDKSYVINNHILYVCNTSHTSTSPFDPTNWTQITVAESLTSLVDAINEVIATSKLNPVYGNTASGAIATFDTSLALPLQDLQIDINAVQESGTPTPSSPKAISGFTGANIHVADDETPHVIDNVTAITWQDEAGTVYGGSDKPLVGGLTATWNGMRLDAVTPTYNSTYGFFAYYNANLPKARKTSSKNIKCECYAVYPNYISSVSQIASLPDKTIYYQNNSAHFFIKDTDYTDATSFINAVGSNLVIYEMETPETITHATASISSIVGTNNIFTDTNGDTSVVYACSLKDYIDSQ